MTERQSNTNDYVDPWASTAPDPQSVLELEAALAEGDEAFDALLTMINDALAACTDRQATIWRLHTGITPDGATRTPMSDKAIGRLLGDQTPASIRSAFHEAHVRVLSRVLAQRMPAHQREATTAMLGRVLAGRTAAQEAQLALAFDAPEYRKGRVDEVPVDNARIDTNSRRPPAHRSSDSLVDAHGVNFGAWERELPRGPLDRQGEEWKTFHQKQLARIERGKKAASS